MEVTFITLGPIVNQRPVGGRAIPMECHEFYHEVEDIEIPDVGEVVLDHSWSMEGQTVTGLRIDADTGIISGKIAIFREQHNCDKLRPMEAIKPGGDNWLNNGSLDGATYDFNFTIKKFIRWEKAPEIGAVDPTPILMEDTFTTDVTLTVIKNNDIDNLMFALRYLETGQVLKIGTREFTLSDFEEFIKVHPGPFGCGK